MIEDDEYLFLLSFQNIILERLKELKRKKKRYYIWQVMYNDIELIINYHEKEMDEYINEARG